MKVILVTAGEAPVLFPGVAPVVIGSVSELHAHRDARLCLDLDFEKIWLDEGIAAAAARAAVLRECLSAPILVNAVIPTIAEIGQPLIRFNGWPGFGEGEMHELVLPDAGMVETVAHVYRELGRAFRRAPDVPGMVSARILAAIVNEAWYTWEQGVSSKAEIDTAMKLGTNYPMGPFEWGERIGPGRMLSLLRAMSREDPRHAPAKSLKTAVEGIKI